MQIEPGITFVVTKANFIDDREVQLTATTVCDGNAWEYLRLNHSERGFLKRTLFCEFGHPKLDHIASGRDKVERLHVVDERNICMAITNIDPLEGNGVLIHARVTGPYGDILKQRLVDNSVPVMFGTRTINGIAKYPVIIGIDFITSSKRIPTEDGTLVWSDPVEVTDDSEFFKYLSDLHCNTLGLPSQIIMSNSLKPLRNHDEVKVASTPDFSEMKFSAIAATNRLPEIKIPGGPVIAKDVDWLYLLNGSYMERNNFTGRVQDGELPADLTPRMMRDGEHEVEWGGELDSFMESVLDIITYDTDATEEMTEQIIKVAGHILNGTTSELLDGDMEYRMYLWTIQLSCFKDSLNWGSSIRHPWFEAGNGARGCKPFKPPFTTWLEEDMAYVIQDSDELKRYWRAVIEFYNQFK